MNYKYRLLNFENKNQTNIFYFHSCHSLNPLILFFFCFAFEVERWTLILEFKKRTPSQSIKKEKAFPLDINPILQNYLHFFHNTLQCKYENVKYRHIE